MDNSNQDNANNEKILFTLSKSENDEVRIRETNFKGKDYVDIRIYTKSPSGEFVPTKKGVMLIRDKMKELRDALDKVKL
jgi:hypothetical protein